MGIILICEKSNRKLFIIFNILLRFSAALASRTWGPSSSPGPGTFVNPDCIILSKTTQHQNRPNTMDRHSGGNTGGIPRKTLAQRIL